MCDVSELVTMVADSNEKSRNLMCDALEKVGLENLVCAFDSTHGLNLSIAQKKAGNTISLLFINTNFKGLHLSSFINQTTESHNGLIAITYSNCIQPEAHIMSMFNNGSFDHIEQNENFEQRVVTVTGRWVKAAKLQFDYGKKYDNSQRIY